MTAPRSPDRSFPPSVLLLALGAVLLRLLLLLGRGDYLAFDEGWYLLLARSLYTGDGYSLVGFPHTALSPLFPVLAGGVGVLLDSWVWGGRVVAAVAAGLVVLPAWAVFRRLASERTAFVAVALVAVLPSLAPFTVPFWIGADLWVGAEPLLHLFLFMGVALWLGADEAGDGGPRGSSVLGSWLLCGAAFGLAFLARPEAIITWGLLGLVALGLSAARRSRRRFLGAVAMGVGFVVLASPYWFYIHDVSGQWRLTGRGVSMPSVSGGPAGRSGASRTIERMLWEDDEAYRERLYGLDATGLRLRSNYWGIQPPLASNTPQPPAQGQPTAQASGATEPSDGGLPQTSGPSSETGVAPSAGTPRSPSAAAPRDPPSPVLLYGVSMGQVFPLLLWILVALGIVRPRDRPRLRRELPVAGALFGTSLAVAAVVAVDPRTQLFLAPLLAFYAARGMTAVEEEIQARSPGLLRPGFARVLLAGTAVIWLLAISGRRLYLSVTLGSPHHIVAAQNRAVAQELDTLVPGDGPVASWHPALAVYADRDWRVLPYAGLPVIVRYLEAAGAQAGILSAYYPPDLGVENLNTRYLVFPIPEIEDEVEAVRVRLVRGDTIRALGELEADEEPGATSQE